MRDERGRRHWLTLLFKAVLINLRVDDQFLPEITILFMGWLHYFNSKFLLSSLGYSKISHSILYLHKSLKLIHSFIFCSWDLLFFSIQNFSYPPKDIIKFGSQFWNYIKGRLNLTLQLKAFVCPCHGWWLRKKALTHHTI